jgi:hypothetical protein
MVWLLFYAYRHSSIIFGAALGSKYTDTSEPFVGYGVAVIGMRSRWGGVRVGVRQILWKERQTNERKTKQNKTKQNK